MINFLPLTFQPVDLPNALTHLRLQRMLTVQTVAQYKFVYSVLIQYLKNSRLIWELKVYFLFFWSGSLFKTHGHLVGSFAMCFVSTLKCWLSNTLLNNIFYWVHAQNNQRDILSFRIKMHLLSIHENSAVGTFKTM